ncbi:hypothetical protein F8M41_008624 [Gigaspora margarita]|uniref:F-box domain-containing protein n=1 Tax=Gigaspora margarita TaxID=4874 RepID=A0A8H3X405_GIGMA|nr:hypothetical protein F8M41_008624 [Gigaspora margarita]
MASKIFMGDMPELMENIFKNLNNEIHFLHSCALVSRHWCKMSIPILWQDPFSFDRGGISFISIYFSSLDEDEKSALKECLEKEKRQTNMEFSKTLFEYSRFLKVLDLYSIKKKIEQLFCVKPKCHIPVMPMNCIVNLLFKLFIENSATLDKLVVYFPEFLKLNPETFYLLEQNMQFISCLQYLSLGIVAFTSIESATTLLRTLAKYATKIRTLILANDSYKTRFFHESLYNIIQFIKSQEQLRLIKIIGIKNTLEFYGIISALESQKNSLQEARIEKLNCKFTTLEIDGEYRDGSTTIQILEMSGLMLKRLKLSSMSKVDEETSIIELEVLKSFCPNITYLNLDNIEFSTQLIEVIGNLQNLQFLTLVFLWSNVDDTKEELER